jgi:hypothetical protein
LVIWLFGYLVIVVSIVDCWIGRWYAGCTGLAHEPTERSLERTHDVVLNQRLAPHRSVSAHDWSGCRRSTAGKSATSVPANDRAACNAKSRSDFIAKLATVVEEADESVYWLDVVILRAIVEPSPVARTAGRQSEIPQIAKR